MAQFTVRVELHKAQSAEYDGAADLRSMKVLTIAQNSTATTGKKNSVLVTEAKSRAWTGLPVSRN